MVPINPTHTTARQTRLAAALRAEAPSVRLQTALTAGSDPAVLETFVERCAAEPDFFARDMLSWALTRCPPRNVLPRIREELGSAHPRARSQALHTLSKINDRSTWAWIIRPMLRAPTTRPHAPPGVPRSRSSPRARRRTWPTNRPCNSAATYA